MRLQWANTLNRKSLPKQVFACSEHFLDGKPTERNPIAVILFLHLQDIKQSTFQKLSVSLMFLNRQVLAPGHNTNIQTVLGKDDHTYAKPWTDNQTTLTQTKILCIDEKGVQVMTETGTMSARDNQTTKP
jgi:nicotinic acid mononucleotide adenylyltransferase